MHIGGGIERSGDFLQDAQGHQSSNTSSANLSGDFHRIRVLTFQNNCYLSYFFLIFKDVLCAYVFPIKGSDVSWNKGRKESGCQLQHALFSSKGESYCTG